MPPLRQPRRRLLARSLARVLILALVAGLPSGAIASVPAPDPIAPEALPELAAVSLPPSGEVLLGVVVVVSRGPLSLTKTAFGELLAHTGTDPQPQAFAAEPLDLNTGWQYHRARCMDPGVGRFTGMDPFAGGPRAPMSLHRYLYANADPANVVDPTGQTPLAKVSISLGIISGLASSGITALRGGDAEDIVLSGLGVGAATALSVYYGVPLLERAWATPALSTAATAVTIQGATGTVSRAALERAAPDPGATMRIVTKLD